MAVTFIFLFPHFPFVLHRRRSRRSRRRRQWENSCILIREEFQRLFSHYFSTHGYLTLEAVMSVRPFVRPMLIAVEEIRGFCN